MSIDEVLNKLAAEGVDLDTTLHRFLDSKDMYAKFLKKFLNDTNYDQMQKDCEEKDYDKLLESSHALKGLTGNLGLDPMFKKLSDMVADIRAKDYSRIDELNEGIKRDYETFKGIISGLD
ncbi:MAG: Hpt domain-containing protein [Lachnospiraceae bacterium]|jgi:hypothetical protein|nr:Hpt domain-containing protein [Lachnospiraceae bacterium]